LEHNQLVGCCTDFKGREREMMKKALINDLGGKVLHYAEAVKTARGIEVRHSVEVRPCVIVGLNEKEAVRLMNEIGALVAGAKIKEIEMLSGDSDYISLGNEGTCESDDQKREVKLGLDWRKSAEEKLRSVMGTGEVVVIFFLVPTFSHGTHYGVVTGRVVSIEKTGATLKVVVETMEEEK
jgi:hypothetical protein